jgi:flagellar motor protein MotB
MRHLRALTVVVALLVLALPCTFPTFGAEPARAPTTAIDPALLQFFESKVRPLLVERCYQCHGPEKQKGGLRLDSAVGLRKGSDSGPVVVAGKPKESLLIKAVNHEGDGPKMPPKTKLPNHEIAILTEWVAKGAAFPEAQLAAAVLDVETARKTYWAFKPPAKPPLPPVKNAAWPANPVDHFILAALEAKGLSPLEPADKRVLIRRAAFDLTGLPPTPEEIDAFLADQSPDAFVKVVDRLLASPAYGERWGRHWLDLVRYADTAGDNSDFPIPQLYKYRNWVIDAFNQDKPYDRFIQEQLAGDLMPATGPGDRKEKIIATGYLANARRFGSYKEAYNDDVGWHLTYEDTIDNLGRTVLGLTINCARCHDHKFDPISTEDFYGLYGFFQSTRYPWPGSEHEKAPRDLVVMAATDQEKAAIAEYTDKLANLAANVKRLDGEKAAAERALKEAEKSDDAQREARIADAKKLVEEKAQALKAAKKEHDQFAARPFPVERAFAVAEEKRARNARVQIKGNTGNLGKEIPRRLPLVLGGQTLPADVKDSGRLQLADWLADSANPLTARVMVNRIWHYHFGKGIVQTPSDFGTRGRSPTHPELLDYLARYFMEGEPGVSASGAGAWSIKKIHRLIMLSRTYQLSSRDDEAGLRIDVNNDYHWRFNRRRLEAEAIRDSILTVTGSLDRSVGGPHPFPEVKSWDFTQHKPFRGVYETNGRSVYLMTQRFQRHPFLALFDGPDTNASTPARITSTTPLQALFLMNDPFVHAQARKLAARLIAERPDDDGRIERAVLLLFGRPPTAGEQTTARDYLRQVGDRLRAAGVAEGQRTAQTWESFARGLFMNNEFVYVD